MHAVAARSALDRRYRALNLMEIQGRGSIVVRLLVKVKACLLKNSLAHTLEAWRSSRETWINISSWEMIYIYESAGAECACSLQRMRLQPPDY
jgi:hypothetical protein